MGELYDMAEHIRQVQSAAGDAFRDPNTRCEYERGLQKEFDEWSRGVLKSIGGHDAPPEQILRQTFQALTEADGKRFILTNLLEGLKGGQSLSALVTRYNEIGLTDLKPEKPPEQFSAAFEPKPGKVVRTLLGNLADFCRELIKLALVALERVCEKLSTQITPSVGWAGWTPTIALSFKAGIDFKKLLDLIAVEGAKA